MFVERDRKLDLAPQVANTFFTLAAQRKLPNWCLGLGLDDEDLRPLTDRESGYTIPRAWMSEEHQILFLSPFFFDSQLIVPLCFFGIGRGRGSVVTLRDIDTDRQYRVYLDPDLQIMRGWCDKEIFQLAREVVT